MALTSIVLLLDDFWSSDLTTQSKQMQNSTMNRPYIVKPDATPRYILGTATIMCAAGANSYGDADMWLGSFQPGQGIPMHLHTREDENIYVIEGELTVQTDEGELKVKAGEFVHLPNNSPHALWNRSESETKVFTIAAPSGMHQVFADLAALPPTAEFPEIAEICARQGITFLPQ